MNLRPAISAPLPWLTILIGRRYRGRAGARRRRRYRLPRSLKVTREGKLYIGVLFVIGLAAINTGNNLLYLVVATLLSLIVISGILSESTLRGLKVRRVLPRRVYKGVPVPMLMEVTNTKGVLPSYSFKLGEGPVPRMEASTSYMLKLNPGESGALTPRYTFTRRGRYRLRGAIVTTTFPFGLFTKGKFEEAADTVIVYPSIGRAEASPFKGEAQTRDGAGKSRKGSGTELYNLRRYDFADDARLIHWKSVARTRRLMVKEYEEASEETVTVVFENRTRPGDEERFEEAVDMAASLAASFIEDGCSVGLKTLGAEIPPAPGHGQLERVLYALALIEPAGDGSPTLKAVHL